MLLVPVFVNDPFRHPTRFVKKDEMKNEKLKIKSFERLMGHNVEK